MRKWVVLALLGLAGFWFWKRRRQPETDFAATPMGAAQAEEQRIVLPSWAEAPNPEDALYEAEQAPGELVTRDDVDASGVATAADGVADLLAAETATIEAIAQAELEASGLTIAPVDQPGATSEPAGTDTPHAVVMGYCVRCKDQRPMINTSQYRTSNKRPAMRGECAVCGAGMFKFMKE